MAVAVGMALAGCGSAPTPAKLHGTATAYLLGIDQLVAPNFMVDVPPHSLTGADIAAAGSGAASTLGSSRLTGAAGEEFFRTAGPLSTLNGPVQIRNTVEVFSSLSGAAAVLAFDASRLDAVHGATAVSTGALGDAAHATVRAAATAGATAVEFTVEWRVENVLDIIVVRGRDGGTRLDDALVLAHRQTAAELGVASASPSATP